jgi:hypothetical protein
MRILASFVIVLTLSVAGCTNAQRAATPRNAPLSPLGSCETRVVSLHGVDAVVNANADSSLASVRIVNSPNAGATRAVLAAIHRAFGNVRADNGLVAQSTKWGLATLTDRCGRPVSPPP